ncbi:hypothetical protein [Actinoplanes sp. TFC3]|uniref:hypothetical protein n=1 Tax=Actinoplanes sp. TFC3 TaxID=1710355 RepID=UPI0008331624|nr:hypothetical protein [Actinoplanes sp. TFC3]
MPTPHSRTRTALIWFAVAAAVVPLLWLFLSSAGLAADPRGDVEHTINAVTLVAFGWSVIAAILLRPPVAALAAVTGAAALLGGTTGLLLTSDAGSGFAIEAWGRAVRGVAFVLPGMSIGYAVTAVARRLPANADRQPTGRVISAATVLLLGTDALGWMVAPGHHLITDPVLDWLAADVQPGLFVLCALTAVPALVALVASLPLSPPGKPQVFSPES